MKMKSEREVAQSSPTLRDPMDCSLPGSSVHEIFQAKILEWIAISFCLAAAAAKSLQLCPTLCDPIDGSPLGSPVPGILQARTLEWVAISFSNALKSKSEVTQSCQTLSDPKTLQHGEHQSPILMDSHHCIEGQSLDQSQEVLLTLQPHLPERGDRLQLGKPLLLPPQSQPESP